jgi:hypothetical protein
MGEPRLFFFEDEFSGHENHRLLVWKTNRRLKRLSRFTLPDENRSWATAEI